MNDNDGVRLNSTLHKATHPSAVILDYKDRTGTVSSKQREERDLKQPPLEHGKCSTGEAWEKEKLQKSHLRQPRVRGGFSSPRMVAHL